MAVGPSDRFGSARPLVCALKYVRSFRLKHSDDGWLRPVARCVVDHPSSYHFESMNHTLRPCGVFSIAARRCRLLCLYQAVVKSETARKIAPGGVPINDLQ